jgi:hypothetical protein
MFFLIIHCSAAIRHSLFDHLDDALNEVVFVPQHAKTGLAEGLAGRRSRGGGLFHGPIVEGLAAASQSVLPVGGMTCSQDAIRCFQISYDKQFDTLREGR